MHLYRQLPSAPHRDALAGFVESVTGVREARPAHAPTLLVPAPTFPAADKATAKRLAKRLAKQPPGRLRKAAAKTCRFDALVKTGQRAAVLPAAALRLGRPRTGEALVAAAPGVRHWRPWRPTTSGSAGWSAARRGRARAGRGRRGRRRARARPDDAHGAGVDAVGGAVTVEVVVRERPWFAFAERVAAEVAAAAAAAEPGVASGDTTRGPVAGRRARRLLLLPPSPSQRRRRQQ